MDDLNEDFLPESQDLLVEDEGEGDDTFELPKSTFTPVNFSAIIYLSEQKNGFTRFETGRCY